jgi:hypothetical protein
MLLRVRTTLVIDDHVFMESKRRAVDAGLTLSEFTTMALRQTLRDSNKPAQHARFSMVTYGAGPKQHTSAQEIAELRDDGR